MSGRTILSARMQAVADMVTPGNRVADVGCDHGYVSIYLVQSGKAQSALAMDIHEGPFLRAREHVEEAGLLPYIELRRSDGLLSFEKGEADTLICAGMGGRLMQKILEREMDKTLSFKELILQPQSEIADFRRFIGKMGYSIIEEDMILEDGKFYSAMKAVRTGDNMTLSETEARFGPILLKRKHPVLKQYLEAQWESSLKLKKELQTAGGGPRLKQRLSELQKEMDYIVKGMVSYGDDYDWRGKEAISQGNTL